MFCIGIIFDEFLGKKNLKGKVHFLGCLKGNKIWDYKHKKIPPLIFSFRNFDGKIFFGIFLLLQGWSVAFESRNRIGDIQAHNLRDLNKEKIAIKKRHDMGQIPKELYSNEYLFIKQLFDSLLVELNREHFFDIFWLHEIS